MPAVDILGSLEQIGTDLDNGKYTNEYDFQLDIYNVINSAYDGHFSYWPDITQVMGFGRELAVVSLSSDGLTLPEVYNALDVPLLLQVNGTNSIVSPIDTIDGQDVETYLNEIALHNFNQDPDANYNTVFPVWPLVAKALALNSTDFSEGFFQGAPFYQGNSTVITYKNGTTQHTANFAATDQDFTNVTDGKSFFQKFCTGEGLALLLASSSSSSSNSSNLTTTEVPYAPVPTETARPAPPRYPDPLVVASDYSISGYVYQEDLAVLAIPTFQPTDPVEFQNVVRELLATAHSKNKTKLIIDLRGNGGGDIFLGYDLYNQLFPSSQPYGLSNFRATPLLNAVGQVVTDYYSNVTAANATAADYNNDYSTPLNIQDELNSALQDFNSWSEFYGPHLIHGDNFTSTVRYNLSDSYQTGGIDPSGFQNLTGIDPVQTFQPENILLVQDGGCASTCTIFTESMKTQAHVRQIAFGGRKQYGPMQGVGSVKGAQIWNMYAEIEASIEAAFAIANPEQQASLKQSYGQLPTLTGAALKRVAVGSDGLTCSVNARNQIREGDETTTPLQFVYEAADCRLFYTPQMFMKQEYVWGAAYNVMWGNGTCVNGSTGQPSSQPGTSYIESPPPAGANNMFGSNITSDYPSDIGPLNSSMSASSSAPTASTTTTGSLPATTTKAAPTASVTNAANRQMVQTGFSALTSALLFSMLTAFLEV